MVTEKGLKKDPELPKKIDYSVFPGHQGGPHINKIAGIAVALDEALAPSFKKYATQIVKNAQILAQALSQKGFQLIGNGSENHMVWIDLQNKYIDGWQAHVTLEQVAIYGNKQTVPFDPRKPYYPSGYRIGTPALTTRGMQGKEMIAIAAFIDEGIRIAQSLHEDDIGSTVYEKDQGARRRFKEKLKKDTRVKKLQQKVVALAKRFPTFSSFH